MNSERLRNASEFVGSNASPPLPCFLRAGTIPYSNQGISDTNGGMCHPCMLSVTHRVNTALAAERNNELCSAFFGCTITGAQNKGSDVMAIDLLCEYHI